MAELYPNPYYNEACYDYEGYTQLVISQVTIPFSASADHFYF